MKRVDQRPIGSFLDRHWAGPITPLNSSPLWALSAHVCNGQHQRWRRNASAEK